jgi:hypothetical protein
MSLNAGGGNLGTIFSTLTYSVMMAVCGKYAKSRRVCLWCGADWAQKFLRSYSRVCANQSIPEDPRPRTACHLVDNVHCLIYSPSK